MTYRDPIDLKESVHRLGIAGWDNALVQVYSGITDHFFITSLIFQLKELLPDAGILGCTTSGEIINDRVTDGQAVITFTRFDRNASRTILVKSDSPLETGRLLGESIKTMEDPRIAIVFYSGISEGDFDNLDFFFEGLNASCPGLPVAGGAAGDNARIRQTYVFTEKGVSAGGAAAAVICGRHLDLSISCYNGCQAIGKEMTVTSARENRIFTLDGEKAATVIRKYIGQIGPETGLNFPLMIARPTVPVNRGVIAMNDDESVDVTANINMGEKVTFSYSIPDKILCRAERLANKWHSREYDAIFAFPCAGRKWSSPEAATLEIKILAGKAPLSGFFTYGEFFWDGNVNEALNQTITLLGISETAETRLDPPTLVENDGESWSQSLRQPLDVQADNQLMVLAFLNNMVKNITEELLDANKKLEEKNIQLELALNEIKTIGTLIPICSSCKKIRDDEGSWTALEQYFLKHTDFEFSHGLCPDCAKKLYPELMDED